MMKLVIISGPTASGKTALALKLARDFNGEIISTDSRQVYKGMDIVTGKDVTGCQFGIPDKSLQNRVSKILDREITLGSYDINSIPLWGVDLVDPHEMYDVTQHVTIVKEIIAHCTHRGKLPILVGGTAFYVSWLLHPRQTGGVQPNELLRAELKPFSIAQLQQKLTEIDPQKLMNMNSSDSHNPRRLIRAIEIGLQGTSKTHIAEKASEYFFQWISLKIRMDTLEQRIRKRVEERIHLGAEAEVKTLINKGYALNLPSMSSIGYREWIAYIQGTISFEEMKKQWVIHERQYAKRQMTWLAKESDVIWFDGEDKNVYNKIKLLVQN